MGADVALNETLIHRNSYYLVVKLDLIRMVLEA